MKKVLSLIIALLLVSSTFVGCTTTTGATDEKSSTQKPVVVATMLDSEGGILGKMMIQMLEHNGIPTTDRVNFGTPDILRKALENKEVDLVLDYTGSGQYYHPDEANDPSVWNDPEAGYQLTAKLDLEKNNILWLTPAQANNTEMIAIKREFAQTNGIKTMSDLAAYINAGGDFKLICSASFAENMLGLRGYEQAYGFSLSDGQLIILSSGNTAEMLKALYEGTNDVNASLVYGTDGALNEMNLLVVEDTMKIPPVYLPTPVLRGEVAAMYPEIEALLKPVFESLTLETLQALNAQVAFDGKDAAAVAEAYLKDNGFVK